MEDIQDYEVTSTILSIKIMGVIGIHNSDRTQQGSMFVLSQFMNELLLNEILMKQV